ncbi:MAG: hypothetical protein IID32_10110, partial [Planctomycetes bacterium]|nr:hypothetical protein [Planctomycetota bacterium]
TTQGYLSNGITKPMTINGQDGEDEFIVFHNLASLSLNGDAGDDFFTVRAFALFGSEEADPNQEKTEVNAGAGADTIMYAVNAPVDINGGDGFDTVIVIGTEFSDDIVVTDQGVFGAGLNVRMVGVESLKVDGWAGNDRIFIASTSENVHTIIFGGLGSDTISIADDPPPVVSNDLRGHSGIITHSVAPGSAAAFLNLHIDGISANVADNDEPGVVITNSDSSIIVSESGLTDTYSVVLTREPEDEVVITVSTSIPPESDKKSLWVSSASAPATAIQLFFNAGNWNIPQIVTVQTNDDDAEEGIQFAGVSHSVISDDNGYNGLPVRTLIAKIHDNDKAGVIIIQSDNTTIVTEGGPDDTYTVTLTRKPDSDVTVSLSHDQQITLSDESLLFIPDDWDKPQTVTITANDNPLREGVHFSRINHIVASADTDFDAVDVEHVTTTIYDNDTPSVLVTQSDGSTDVIEGPNVSDPSVRDDTYTLVLTQQPTSTITIDITPQSTKSQYFNDSGDLVTHHEIQVAVSPSQLTFDPENWDSPKTVTVTAIDDDFIDGGDVKAFAPVAKRVNLIRGPLTINGGEDPEADRSIPAPIMLPGETDPEPADPLPIHPNLLVNESAQTDTLNLFNNDAVADQTGTLTNNRITGLGLGQDTTIGDQFLPGGITYSAFENLNIHLGSGSDTFNVIRTHDRNTTITSGPGADTINIRRIEGPTSIDSGPGNDIFNVGTNAPATGGVVDRINDLLTIRGGTQQDTLNVDDTAEIDNTQVKLTGSTLTGMDMSHGINYQGIDLMNVNLGSGHDTINVKGTTAVTHLNLNDGDERVYVSSQADVSLGESIDFLQGHLDNILGDLHINAGTGRHQLMFSDYSATAGDADVRITDQP